MSAYEPPTKLTSRDFESRKGKYFTFETLTSTAASDTSTHSSVAPAASKAAAKLLSMNNVDDDSNVKVNERSTALTTGRRWFNMQSPELTDEVKRDLRMLRLRAFFDPKQNWKKDDFAGKRLPTHFQIGTVIAGLGEHTLKKRDRHETITGEVLADEGVRKMAKRVYDEVAAKQQSGGKRDYARRQNQKRGRLNKKRFI